MRHHSRVVIALCLLFTWIAVGAVTPAAAGAKGRYKISNGKCVWDANDSGPNQCDPPKGRFKTSNGNCVWDAKDSGPDQCKPRKGRFKKENGGCVWSSEDSGPNQCDPRNP